MKTELILLTMIILLFLAILCIVRYYRQEIAVFSRALDDTLDRMLENGQPDFSISDDSLIGKLNNKLKRLYEILGDKTAQSKREHEELQSLISDISHQVKTPVANLKMYNQILSERTLDDAKRREFLSLSLSQTEKLEFLMEALIEISRLENGIIRFSPAKLHATELIAAPLAQIMPYAEEKHISIRVDCPAHIFAVCDKKWTAEAIFNILDNAIKYTPENGSVTVLAKQDVFYTQIQIKDSGAGIPEVEQAKIWGRFYRCKSAKDVEGLGIGLFLSREIIQNQGGFILVKSEPPDGAQFIVNLPCQSTPV